MTWIFEDTLRSLLVETTLCGTRVFLVRAPQKPNEQMKTPYMVYFPTGPEPIHHMTGPLETQVRNYQVSIFDDSQSRALAIADSLREALDGLINPDYQGVDIGSVWFKRQTMTYETDTKLYHVMPEFRFMFRKLQVTRYYETNNVQTKGSL